MTPDQAVFAPEGTHVPDGRHPVARWLCEDENAKEILEKVLEVKPLDDEMWINALYYAVPQHSSWELPSDNRWRTFWRLLRSAPENARSRFVANDNRVSLLGILFQ
ncbi:MAG TPA: hypothetical protein PKZ53_26930, partial [Acidobacteriota bacterium]|nr:hypothetical protein [Acidobacteriota bacterium]